MTLHTYPKVDQGTEEWHALRRGIVTASVVGKLITVGSPDAWTVDCPTCKTQAGGPCMSLAAKKTPTPIKTLHDARVAAAADMPPVYGVADNETSQGLILTLTAERIAGWTETTPMTSDMFRGVVAEPYAREFYSEHHAPVTEVGFMLREEDGWRLGFSPDGLVGNDGLIEVKSPRAKTHVRTVLAGEVPAHYMAQCQAGLLVSGRKWIDFVSFVGGLSLWVQRVTPDPAWFEVIEAACRQFEKNAEAMTDAYLARVKGLPLTERIPDDLEVVV